MLLLQFLQSELTMDVGLFESEDQIKEWLEQLPIYEEDEVYFLDGDKLNDYIEISYQNSRYPVTSFSFDESESILISWTEVPVISQTDGLVDGVTKVDAYMIDNADLKDYISAREEAVSSLMNHYREKGQQVDRAGHASEDGEYLLLDGELLTHLDPMFVDQWKKSVSVDSFTEQFEEE
ncbi:hypothetical protein [Macrococcus carouselicus]|uniref:Uncharacterized protein n=1 Tax=Macrococcus carouselicus TaxID=69969 RepID=A0A9Q8CIX1_9STAP|nr:hypothetical protein [Macrococcus carouselicus]TDM02272.1 hypothetical protein ERX40_06880 [Macrococcus carouselicus]